MLGHMTLHGQILPCLTDVSPRDFKWSKYKIASTAISDIYAASTNEIFHSYAKRITDCSSTLHFVVDDDCNLKLISANFCRVRYCVVCQWRRSMMWKSKAIKSLEKILEDYPKYRWLFLTLTVQNCDIKNLRDTLKSMNSAFARFVRRKEFKSVVGWVRSTEITRGNDCNDEGVSNAHPHFHCLLMMKPSYFTGKHYLKLEDWSVGWQKSLKSVYTPVVYVTALKESLNPKFIVPEVLKYSTKPSDLLDDKNWLFDLTKQTYKMRFVATGGILKEYMADLKDDPDDLIGKSEDDDSVDVRSQLVFDWDKHYKVYKSKS